MPSEGSESYGRYSVEWIPRSRGFCESLHFCAQDRRRPGQLALEFAIEIVNAPTTLPRLAQEGEPLNLHESGLSCIHGLLDFGLFERASRYTLSRSASGDSWQPPLVLDAPALGDDPDRLIQCRILGALLRARQELPTEYKAKRLDPSGACRVLQIDRDQFDYNVGLLEEKGWVAPFGAKFAGDFYITTDGVQAVQEMSRSPRPEWQTKQAPEEVQKQIPEIVEAIRAWPLKQRYRTEEAYESALAEYLQGKGIAAPEQQGASLVDILAAHGVGIELRVTPDRSEYDRLVGQIVRHLREHGNVIVLIIRSDKADLLDEYEDLFSNDDRVKFISKG